MLQLSIRRSATAIASKCGAGAPATVRQTPAREALRDIHQAKHFGSSPPTHSTRLNGLWLAAPYPAHRSATMAPIHSTEFDLSKCFKGEQQLVYVYDDCISINDAY